MLDEQSKTPDFILSEACYGANIFDKTHEEALSLKFLDNGSNTFVGSTCIAYGSVTTPINLSRLPRRKILAICS